MNNRIKRLERLQTLRARLADAAAAECRQISAGLNEADNTVSQIAEEIAEALAPADAATHSWTDQYALLAVSRRRLQQLAVRKEELLVSHAVASAAEQHAVQSREQMQRILERRVAAEALLDSRRLQAQLDDAHAIARVRNGMPTRF